VKYFYFLVASDSSQNMSQHSELFSVTVTTDQSLSTEKIDFSLTVKKKNVVLKWDNMKYNGEKSKYIVYKDDGTGFLLPVSGMIMETKFKDSAVRKSKSYKYQVRAYSEEDGVIGMTEEKEIVVK
jgi:hypothetical protein